MGQISLQDIIELTRIRDQAITDIKKLITCKDSLKNGISQSLSKGQVVKNDESASENMGFLPGGSVAITLHLNQQHEFADDSVGAFQRQALCQKHELLEGMNPMALDTQQLKQLFICPHPHKKHYAKNMCHNCYHNKGKSKKATACSHTTKPHYSNGLCQNCYLAQYYLKRKKKHLEKQKAKLEGACAENAGDPQDDQGESQIAQTVGGHEEAPSHDVESNESRENSAKTTAPTANLQDGQKTPNDAKNDDVLS